MTEMFLVGRDIGHSLSPAMWNHLFVSTGRSVRYGLRDVGYDGLDGVLDEIRSGSVLAANVTMPYKGWAAESADEVAETVVPTRAANVLMCDGSTVRALNTDVVGARAIMEVEAPFESVLVLGAGGTAVAMLEALTGLTETVHVTNRSEDRADDLVERYRSRFAAIDARPWERRHDIVPSAALVVSTVPAVDTSPIEVERLPIGVRVYDAIYRRRPTSFQLRLAHRGVAVADGLAHLATQAIAMLDPLGYDPEDGRLLVEGLEQATGRSVRAWGRSVA